MPKARQSSFAKKKNSRSSANRINHRRILNSRRHQTPINNTLVPNFSTRTPIKFYGRKIIVVLSLNAVRLAGDGGNRSSNAEYNIPDIKFTLITQFYWKNRTKWISPMYTHYNTYNISITQHGPPLIMYLFANNRIYSIKLSSNGLANTTTLLLELASVLATIFFHFSRFPHPSTSLSLSRSLSLSTRR